MASILAVSQVNPTDDMASGQLQKPLRIYNSLTRQKEIFTPIDPAGRRITWYCCGPTVYDHGHLGHARNYVSTDVIRRILQDYFGYDVTFAMNVTDVDDKIIVRARQMNLFNRYIGLQDDRSKYPDPITLVRKAYHRYISKYLPLIQGTDPADFSSAFEQKYRKLTQGQTVDGAGPVGDEAAKILSHRKTVIQTVASLQINTKPELLASSLGFPQENRDVLQEYLDDEEGAGFDYDPHVVRSFTSTWETCFRKDLERLNCLEPSIVSRVSEYMDAQVKFIEKLTSKGFAYQAGDGTVRFDVNAFEAAGNQYARLKPENRDNEDLRQESLGTAAVTDGVKSKSDFALWKLIQGRKKAEPGWPSPWGPGRPGWHLECSVMASDLFGARMDIHSGGIDLAFPHHDNELAQSEAYWVGEHTVDGACCEPSNHRWVNYFMHMGHLSIAGSKMSKSLKNFTVITDALQEGGSWTARRLRLEFLLARWDSPLELVAGGSPETKAWEQRMNNFFSLIQASVREQGAIADRMSIRETYSDQERLMMTHLTKAREALHDALVDSFNTPIAMQVLSDLVRNANVYMSARSSDTSVTILKEVGRWISSMLRIFGLQTSDAGQIQWVVDNTSSVAFANGTAADSKSKFDQTVSMLSKFRDSIRTEAMTNTKDPLMRTILQLCDIIRDKELPPLGIALEDRNNPDGSPKAARIHYKPPHEILAAQNEKKNKQEAVRLAAEKRIAEKLEKSKINPMQMFRTEEYEEWDENGMPTKMQGGEEISKNRKKKLEKEWGMQKKLHDDWLKNQPSEQR